MKVRVEKSAFGGSSLAFIEGKAVFIPLVIPGETVDIGGISDKKDYLSAQAVSIDTPSADRIKPECLNYGRCGGCDYLHMSYERELEEKRVIIRDSLRRIGKFSDDRIPEIETVSGQRFHYRSHASVKQANFKKGFYSKETHEVAPFTHDGCLLLGRGLHDAIMRLQTESTGFKVAVDRSGHVHTAEMEHSKTMEEECLGIKYKRDIQNFFQANMKLRGGMVKKVIEYASPLSGSTVLELGCGCGFFSLPLAREAQSLKGIEISRESAAYAVENAVLNKIENAHFECRSDESIHAERDRADIVVADPPRAGLSKRTRGVLSAMASPLFVYISCNPSTWARDAKDMCDAGYRLAKVCFIDMFPGTQHIEIISRFER